MTARTAARNAATAAFVFMMIFSPACGGDGSGTGDGEVIKRIPLDSHSEILARKNVTTDSNISRDGNGSLRIDVKGTQTHQLYRFGDIDVENAILVYQAALRTEDLQGEAFLEIKCFFQANGELVTRGYEAAISGTSDWTVTSTPFRLLAGQNPDVVELNIIVTGRGTVWVDDIKLLKKPLN